MAARSPSTGPVRQQVKQATRNAVAHPWFERLARFGYASKGVVYLIAGLFTARAAFGLGGQATDKNGALLTILAEPFGKFMLVLIGVGLIGYVLLRFVQALLDPEHKGTDAKGMTQRAGYLLSGLLYGSLALTALRLAIGMGVGAGDQTQGLAARVFEAPLGRWLVGIAGLIVIGGGLYQLYKAYSADFSEHFRWNDMSSIERTWAAWLGRIGLAARGIVQTLVGLFMVQAAVLFDASRVQGSGSAIQSLAHPPFGLWTVGVVALGLASYGVYMLAAAKYSRIVTQ
ncbi:MAG: DUF1206 domain-containing protein [Roseiflexaceae bacterium]